MNLCSQTNKREAGPSATFSPGSYSGLPPADKYTNFFSYGNKKENKHATEPVIRFCCKDNDAKGAVTHGPGDQDQARKNCPHQPDSPFKDIRKWRAKTKEQAQ